MNYEVRENEVFNLLTAWDFIRRWWWFWLGAVALGTAGITVFDLAVKEPPGRVYSSNAVLLVSKEASTGFYETIADMWLAERETVGHSRATSDAVIELEIEVKAEGSDNAARVNTMMYALIAHMKAKGSQLRAIQTEERLNEARALADFTGVASSLVDPRFLAPSLGTITIIQAPFGGDRIVEGTNHIQRLGFAGNTSSGCPARQ